MSLSQCLPAGMCHPDPSIPRSSLHLYTNTSISSPHWSISLHPYIHKDVFHQQNWDWASKFKIDHPDSDLIPRALFHTDRHNNSIGHWHQTMRRLIIECDQNFTISALICKLFIISQTLKGRTLKNDTIKKETQFFHVQHYFKSLSEDKWFFNDLYSHFETLFNKPNWNQDIVVFQKEIKSILDSY